MRLAETSTIERHNREIQPCLLCTHEHLQSCYLAVIFSQLKHTHVPSPATSLCSTVMSAYLVCTSSPSLSAPAPLVERLESPPAASLLPAPVGTAPYLPISTPVPLPERGKTSPPVASLWAPCSVCVLGCVYVYMYVCVCKLYVCVCMYFICIFIYKVR